ncbi:MULTISPECIES: hypothetical protein [unclassified Variovorax]
MSRAYINTIAEFKTEFAHAGREAKAEFIEILVGQVRARLFEGGAA